MLKFFAEKNVSSFCNAKATHIFSAKNIKIMYIESAKTVNEMTLNKLVKLTTLWTTGPWTIRGTLPSSPVTMAELVWDLTLNNGLRNIEFTASTFSAGWNPKISQP